MSKSAITKLFVGSMVAIVAGVLMATAALIAAFAGGGFVMDGPDVVGVANPQFTWPLIALIIVAGLAIVGGAIGGLVSWIGALLNTVQLDDKLWFIVLLVLGLLSFGFIAMIAYVIAGPDGTIHGETNAPRPVNLGVGA
jgi:H+/Cl- antiporter ClcA